MKPKFHYHVQHSVPLLYVMNQMNPPHILLSSFLKIEFSTSLPSMPKFFKLFFIPGDDRSPWAVSSASGRMMLRRIQWEQVWIQQSYSSHVSRAVAVSCVVYCVTNWRTCQGSRTAEYLCGPGW